MGLKLSHYQNNKTSKMLRDYQDNAVNLTAQCFRHSDKGILAMPTGSGKTRCGSVIALRAMNKGNEVDILVHRRETARQFQKTLRLLGHDPEMCWPENKNVDWSAPIIIGMVETYHKRKSKHNRKAKLMIIDEAHRGEFRKVIADFDGKVLGLTATPIASAKDEPLNKYFQFCINPIKTSYLIENKYLCQADQYHTAFSCKNLKILGGEYSEKSQYAEFTKPKLYKGALQQYQKYASGRKAICYNVNVDHSWKMHSEFTMAGIKSWHIDGKTNDDDRDRIFQEFNDYEGGCVLHNVGIATTGTDIPSVECIILNRATTQLSLYHQMTGRGGRIIEGVKYRFIIIDMGGNTERFRRAGVYGADIDWQMHFNNPEGATQDGRKPKEFKKSCPKCAKTMNIRTLKCSCCNYEFTKEEALKSAELTQDLVLMRQIAKHYMPNNLKKPTQQMSYKELCQYAEYMGYSPRWAGKQMGLKKDYHKNVKPDFNKYINQTTT
jgi:superfamily II DNA or RNA helicase